MNIRFRMIEPEFSSISWPFLKLSGQKMQQRFRKSRAYQGPILEARFRFEVTVCERWSVACSRESYGRIVRFTY